MDCVGISGPIGAFGVATSGPEAGGRPNGEKRDVRPTPAVFAMNAEFFIPWAGPMKVPHGQVDGMPPLKALRSNLFD